MTDPQYQHWSKASIYLKSLRDGRLKCGISSFYKYCRLLGFKNKPRKPKSDSYSPTVTTKPNQLWCADVTIVKTQDNIKHYLHLLMDHYSKLILGYRLVNSPSGAMIKELLQDACHTHRPEELQFLTDGGSENVNSLVSGFINSPEVPISHIIAQKDVVFSNSMIEALNKTIKHQFLYPHQIANRKQLQTILEKVIPIYNTVRPQMSLGGNTPIETFNGRTIDLSQYTCGFEAQKAERKQQNKAHSCNICL